MSPEPNNPKCGSLILSILMATLGAKVVIEQNQELASNSQGIESHH